MLLDVIKNIIPVKVVEDPRFRQNENHPSPYANKRTLLAL